MEPNVYGRLIVSHSLSRVLIRSSPPYTNTPNTLEWRDVNDGTLRASTLNRFDVLLGRLRFPSESGYMKEQHFLLLEKGGVRQDRSVTGKSLPGSKVSRSARHNGIIAFTGISYDTARKKSTSLVLAYEKQKDRDRMGTIWGHGMGWDSTTDRLTYYMYSRTTLTLLPQHQGIYPNRDLPFFLLPGIPEQTYE